MEEKREGREEASGWRKRGRDVERGSSARHMPVPSPPRSHPLPDSPVKFEDSSAHNATCSPAHEGSQKTWFHTPKNVGSTLPKHLVPHLQAMVEHDPAACGVRDMIGSLEDIGFKAAPWKGQVRVQASRREWAGACAGQWEGMGRCVCRPVGGNGQVRVQAKWEGMGRCVCRPVGGNGQVRVQAKWEGMGRCVCRPVGGNGQARVQAKWGKGAGACASRETGEGKTEE
eukprot:364020-Chlamydomonas_euryale.AAC.4